jgi:putative ABC transport system permease protein
VIRVAAQTLRTRWASFLGTAVALVLGVAQVAAMSLLLVGLFDQPPRPVQRFAAAPAVVQPDDPTWNASHNDPGVLSLPSAKGISAQVLRKVSLTGPVVVDRSFYAQLGGGPASEVGHPWPAARFGGYRLTAGAPPSADTQVVVPAGEGKVGEAVTVLTASGSARYTVSGTVSPVGWEQAVFFTETEAARLSPRIDDVVALGPLDRVRAAVEGAQASVLTGDERHQADPSQVADTRALDDTVTLVPVMAGIAGIVAIFVVASTFAFAVVQRRRELALLRAVGATPKQVRRMVRGEALLVGAVASALGVGLGLLGTQWLTDLLVSLGVTPSWFHVGLSTRWTVLAPLAGAFLVGLLVAVGGAVTAARRAGAVQPIEALREAAAEAGGSTPGRRLLGVIGVVGGVAWAAMIAIDAPGTVLSPNTYVMSLTIPVVAAAVIAPLAAGPIAQVLMWPLRNSSGPTAMLVRASVLTARRRVGATAAPVLLTVGLAFSLLAATGSLSTARDSQAQDQVSAPYALVPKGTPGISPEVTGRVARIPGVRVTAILPTSIFTPDGTTGDGAVHLSQNDALVLNPAALSQAMKLPGVTGSLAGLNDDSMVAPDIWDWPVGSRIPVYMADGQAVTLRVAATYHAVRGGDLAYLPERFAATAAYAGNGLVQDAYVSFAPGADRAAALTAVRRAADGAGAQLVTRSQLVSSESSYSAHLIRVRQESTAVIIMLFCFIAILNTLLMATADRRRDLAVLRTVGATPRQVLWFFVAETLLVMAIALVLALAATAVNLGALHVALLRLFGSGPISAPYAVIAGIAAVSGLLALAGTVLPVGAALRARTVHLVNTGG